jgi:hypothetical protein
MTKQTSRMMALVVFAGLVLGVVGCKSVSRNSCAQVCKDNTEAGLPTIQCQPLDTTVGEKETATFKVTAVGKNLEFQWYRNGYPLTDTEGFKGAKRPQLFISDVSSGKVGNYFCRIIGTDCSEFPISTDTRMATLGYVQTFKPMAQTIQHQPLPPGSSGTSICGPYCAYVPFQTGFKPATGQTLARAKVRLSNSTSYLPVGSYNLFWQASVLERGCATNYTDMEKSFSCKDTKTYKFIVYFTGNTWPLPGAAGADVLLDVN